MASAADNQFARQSAEQLLGSTGAQAMDGIQLQSQTLTEGSTVFSAYFSVFGRQTAAPTTVQELAYALWSVNQQMPTNTDQFPVQQAREIYDELVRISGSSKAQLRTLLGSVKGTPGLAIKELLDTGYFLGSAQNVRSTMDDLLYGFVSYVVVDSTLPQPDRESFRDLVLTFSSLIQSTASATQSTGATLIRDLESLLLSKAPEASVFETISDDMESRILQTRQQLALNTSRATTQSQRDNEYLSWLNFETRLVNTFMKHATAADKTSIETDFLQNRKQYLRDYAASIDPQKVPSAFVDKLAAGLPGASKQQKPPTQRAAQAAIQSGIAASTEVPVDDLFG